MTSNRMWNCSNPNQSYHKKVLCICSAGLLRSPTAAFVLNQEPFCFNTRAAGIADDYALIIVDRVLLHWANEVVCVEQHITDQLYKKFPDLIENLNVVTLSIPDNFPYRDEKLIKIIKEQYIEATNFVESL